MPFNDVKKIGQLSRKDEELRKAREDLGMNSDGPKERSRDSDVNEPGSAAYLKRRDRELQDDLRNAPRRPR